MAEKRYYWLKLKEDFFRSKDIKKLRKIAGGDTYTIIYLKMMLLSLKNDGKIFFEGVENTLAEELALDLDENEDNVVVTLEFLKSRGLIEEISPEEFSLTETIKSIESKCASALRVEKHREKKKAKEEKALHCNADVTDVTLCNDYVTYKRYGDIDIDIYIEQQQHKDNKNSTNDSNCQDTLSTDFQELSTNFTDEDMSRLCVEMQKNGIDPAVITSMLMSEKEETIYQMQAFSKKNKSDWAKISNPTKYFVTAISKKYRYAKDIHVMNKKANSMCPECHGTGKITMRIGNTEETATVICKCVH